MNPSRPLQSLLLLPDLALLLLLNTLFTTVPEDTTQSRGANLRDYVLIAIDTLPGVAIVAMYALVLTGRHLKQPRHYKIHVACRVVCTLAIAATACYLPARRLVAMQQALTPDSAMSQAPPPSLFSSPPSPSSTNGTAMVPGPRGFRQMYLCDRATYKVLGEALADTCVRHLAKTGVSLAVAALLLVELVVAGICGDLRRRRNGEGGGDFEDEKKKGRMDEGVGRQSFEMDCREQQRSLSYLPSDSERPLVAHHRMNKETKEMIVV